MSRRSVVKQGKLRRDRRAALYRRYEFTFSGYYWYTPMGIPITAQMIRDVYDHVMSSGCGIKL